MVLGVGWLEIVRLQRFQQTGFGELERPGVAVADGKMFDVLVSL
jgi:hypothetical protein